MIYIRASNDTMMYDSRTHHEQDTSIFRSYTAASEPATDDSQYTCDDQGVSQSGIRRRGHKGHVAVFRHHCPDTDAAHHQSGQLQEILYYRSTTLQIRAVSLVTLLQKFLSSSMIKVELIFATIILCLLQSRRK